MTQVLVAYFVFLGLSAFVSRLFISRYHTEHIISLIFTMIVLFVFGCVQQLGVGIKVVIACAVIGGGLSLWRLLKGGEKRFALLRQAVELAIFFAIALIISWGAEYWVWDEFSHWGAEVEFLSITGNLPMAKESLVFPNYIPGITLLRYFATTLLDGSGVSASYFMTWLFSLACLYCVAYSQSVSKWLVTLLVIFFTYLALFQSLVLTLLVDPLQALLFLCALRFARETDNESFWITLFSVAGLVLLKHVGIILAVFVCAYFVANRYLIAKQDLKSTLIKGCVLFVPTVAIYASWEIYVAAYDMVIKFRGPSVLFMGPGFVSNTASGMHHVLTNLFPHANFLAPAYPLAILTPGIPLWEFICLMTGFGWLVNFSTKTDKKSAALAFALLLLTGVGYLFFLAYVTVASGWFNDVQSFSRYFLVVFFATFLLLFLVARENLSIVRGLLIAIAMAALSYVVAPPMESIFVQSKRPPVPLNEEYRIKAAQLKKYATGTELILYIDGKDSSFGYFMFRQKTLPLRYMSYNQTYFIHQSDSEIQDRLNLFRKRLCRFDYVYADNSSEEFWNRNASVFDIPGGHVYKVTRVDAQYCSATLLEK